MLQLRQLFPSFSTAFTCLAALPDHVSRYVVFVEINDLGSLDDDDDHLPFVTPTQVYVMMGFTSWSEIGLESLEHAGWQVVYESDDGDDLSLRPM